MRIRVWLRRSALALAALMALALVLAVLAIRSEWGRGQVRQLIESQASQFLDGTLRIGRVSGSLLRGVTLSDVSFDRRGQTAFSARRIDVEYSAWGLWRGRREIRAIRVIDLVVRLEESQGHWSTGEWLKPRPSSGRPAAPFTLAKIEIVNGRLLSKARAGVWRLPEELDRINGELGLRLGGPTELTLVRLSFATPDAAFEARSATGVVTFGNDGTRFEALRVASAAGTIQVDGTIGTPAPGGRPVDLTAALERLDTRVWRRFSPLMDTVALEATGPLTIGGTFDRTMIRGTLTTTAGRLVTDTVIASSAREVRITGSSDLARFNAEAVTLDPQWASEVSGKTRYTVVGTGAPARWTATVSLVGGPVRAFGADADSLDGSATYANGLVTFEASAAAYGATAHVAGTVRTSPTVVIDVAGDRLERVDPRRLPAAWGFPQLDAQTGAETFAAHWTAGEWNVTARLTESVVEGATVAGGTTVQLASNPAGVSLQAEGSLRDLDARRLGRALKMAGLDDPLFETRLSGRIRLTGRGRTWQDIDLSGRGHLADSEAGRAVVTNAEVTFAREAHRNSARIVGAVLRFDPVKVGGPAALAGSMNGAVDLSVEWRDDVADMASGMEARGTWRLTPSIVAQEPVDRGVISGEWRDGAFNAQTIDLEGPGLHVTGRGRFAVTKGVSAATFELIATDVHSLEPWTGRVIHGAATARGELRGPFDAPRITGSAESAEITDAELGRFTHVSATIDFTLPAWESLKTQGPLRVQAAGWTSAAGAVAHEVVFDGRLDSWTAFRGRAGGRFNAIVAEAAILADWANELTVDIAAASLTRGADQWRLDPASGRLRVTSSRLIATNVRLTNGLQSIGVDGTLLIGAGDLTPGDRLTASAVNLDLAPVDRFLGLDTGLSGRLTASASLAGRLSDPRGRIVVNARELSVRGYAMNSLNGGIDLGAGAAVLDVAMRQPDGVAFKAIGRVPLSAVLPAGSLDASVPTPDWDVNVVTDPVELRIFGALVPRVDEIEGQMIADVRIVGAADRPRVTGTIALADAAFRVPSAGIGFSNITADIGFQPDLVTVRKFVARDKHGHPLTITGNLAVSERQVGALNINVEADRLAIVDNAIGSIELSALLQLSGDVWHPKLTGNIEVVNGRVEVDRLLRVLSGDALALVAELNLPAEGETPVDVRGDAARAAAAGPAPSVFDSRSFLSGLDAEVRILAPDNLILRGSRIRPGGKGSWSLGDLNVTVGGELTTTRRPGGAPVVVGDVTTIRGVYSFEGRRFEIQRGGRIRFNGDVPMNPSFDVRGVRRIQGVEARVDVRGRLSDPTLQLGSNLPLDEADVLSMIIFNRPVNQLGETQRADLVGAAASLAGGFVTSPLASKLSRALDLDLLELETVTFGQNVAPRIRVGQQIGHRLFVQFAQQFGPQSLSELTAEYQLARFLRLQANTAQGPGSRAQRSLTQRSERFGLDLIFFFNY